MTAASSCCGPVAFSADGRRVVTASYTARVWDVLPGCCRSHLEADRLATLAETLSGLAVSETGSLDPVSYDRRGKSSAEVRLHVTWLLGRTSGSLMQFK